MDDILVQLTGLNQQYPEWITWGGLFVLLSVVGLALSPLMLRLWKEWRMARCIHNLAEDTLTDVFLSDGVDGVHYFPFIVLTRQAVIFFKSLQFRGIIFAADTIDYWTQVVGKRSYKFHNPMPGVEAEAATIRTLDKDIAVQGRVVFPSDSHFPKGRPQAVILENEIKRYLQEMMQGKARPELRSAWDRLRLLAGEGQQEKYDKLLMSKPRVLSSFRVRLVWLFTLLSVSWLLFRLM